MFLQTSVLELEGAQTTAAETTLTIEHGELRTSSKVCAQTLRNGLEVILVSFQSFNGNPELFCCIGRQGHTRGRGAGEKRIWVRTVTRVKGERYNYDSVT